MSEYLFRDFMVGWLADQQQVQTLTYETALTLYDAVIFATDEDEAFLEIAEELGPEQAQRLRGQSQQAQDDLIETASPLIERLREEVTAHRDVSEFYQFFLNPFKDDCVPAGFEEDLHSEICWMFQTLYNAAAADILEPQGWQPDVIVEPAHKYSSRIVVLAQSMTSTQDRTYLFARWHKAWQVRFASLYELAQQLLTLHRMVEQSLQEAILGYRVIKTVRDVMGQTTDPSTDQSPSNHITTRVTIEVRGGVATVVDRSPGVEVEIIDFDTGLAHS